MRAEVGRSAGLRGHRTRHAPSASSARRRRPRGVSSAQVSPGQSLDSSRSQRPWRPSPSRRARGPSHAPQAPSPRQSQLHADGRSPHTVAQYTRHLRELGGWAEQRGLHVVRDIEPKDVAEYLGSPVATRRADGRRRDPVTVNSRRTSLRMFFAYLESIDSVERSPARVLRMARTRQPEPRAMPPSDVERLLGVLSDGPGKAAQRDHALVAFILATGARLSSALGLRVEDLELAGGTATLRDVKGGGAHTVFLRSDVVALLCELVGDRENGPVFEARDGGQLSTRQLQRRFEEWLVRAGVSGRYSPHSLRHRFALGLSIWADRRRAGGPGRAWAPGDYEHVGLRQGLG
ncbi:MAG: tyrosine-type recombinase/integrase [Planctomycetota bacterium]